MTQLIVTTTFKTDTVNHRYWNPANKCERSGLKGIDNLCLDKKSLSNIPNHYYNLCPSATSHYPVSYPTHQSYGLKLRIETVNDRNTGTGAKDWREKSQRNRHFPLTIFKYRVSLIMNSTINIPWILSRAVCHDQLTNNLFNNLFRGPWYICELCSIDNKHKLHIN